jgi:PAS domain S-box-containing protein
VTDPSLEGLDNAELRRRLAEAEETLRAIREGDADALVVRAADDDAVFALAGGEDSYRAIMEAMDTGAVALDGRGKVLYANAALRALLGCTAAELQRDGLFAQLDDSAVAVVGEVVRRAGQGRDQAQFSLSRGGSLRHYVVTGASLPLAFGTGVALTLSDVTARMEAASVEESERIGRAVLASANEAVIVCDRDGLVTNANAAAALYCRGDPVGQRFDEALPLVFPIGGAVLHVDDLLALACGGNAMKGLEASAPAASPPRDVLVSVAPLRLSGEAIGGSLVTLVDLTERKATEKRQTLLMHELDHRVKNTLAMVLSICGRTISGSHDLEDFRLRFTRRIQALAATHNLLADAAWAGLDLAAVVHAELAPYASTAGPRLVVRDMNRFVAPNIGIAFGLVVHELATNAVKYGALSRESGVVTVSGRAQADGAFEITWTERGGPPVSEPSRHGFGQTLITRSLRSGPGTGADVEFAPEGVVCRMVLPVNG